MDRGTWWATVHWITHKESDTTGRLHFHFSLSCTGEGNGNPLQYSCLEKSMDRGTWWTTVHWITHKESDTTEGLTLPLFFVKIVAYN